MWHSHNRVGTLLIYDVRKGKEDEGEALMGWSVLSDVALTARSHRVMWCFEKFFFLRSCGRLRFGKGSGGEERDDELFFPTVISAESWADNLGLVLFFFFALPLSTFLIFLRTLQPTKQGFFSIFSFCYDFLFMFYIYFISILFFVKNPPSFAVAFLSRIYLPESYPLFFICQIVLSITIYIS